MRRMPQQLAPRPRQQRDTMLAIRPSPGLPWRSPRFFDPEAFEVALRRIEIETGESVAGLSTVLSALPWIFCFNY
jgi:hypothetical protein